MVTQLHGMVPPSSIVADIFTLLRIVMGGPSTWVAQSVPTDNGTHTSNLVPLQQYVGLFPNDVIHQRHVQ